MKTNEQFITDLITTFPDIKEEVLDEDYINIMSLQIGCFRHFTQEMIDSNNLKKVKACFLFVDANYDLVTSTTQNTLAASYLGKLKINENSAMELLPPKLLQLRKDLGEYYASLEKDESLNAFLKDLET